MIRILHVLGNLNMGGAETMVMNLYRNVDRSKIQFDFLLHGDIIGDYEDEVKSLGGKIYRVPRYNGYNHFQYKRAIKQFFVEHPEYKIIHSHIRSTASIILRIAKQQRLKTISHSHSISNGKGLKAIIKKIYQRQIPNYADYMFACSNDAAQWLYGKKYLNSNRCVIIPNAINIENFKYNVHYRNEIRKKYNIASDVTLVGHVGRFDKAKNHEFIIDLIKNMSDEPKIMFMLCGDGSLKNKIINRAKSENIDKKIIFVANNNEIYKYYSAFDLFILPSLYEGLGMVLIEAQFSGLYCITSKYIPIEAKITDNFNEKEFVCSEWKKSILTRKKINRNNIKFYKSAEKYNISESSKTIVRIYTMIQKDIDQYINM